MSADPRQAPKVSGAVDRVQPRGLACDGERVISRIDQALSAGMVTSSVVSVAGPVPGRMRQGARTSRPR